MSINSKFNKSIKGSNIQSISQVAKLIKTDPDKLKYFLDDPEMFMRYNFLKLNGELNATGRVFSYLVGGFNNYPILFYTQKTIGSALDLDRMTVHLAIKKLVKNGFLNKIYRSNHPCLYGLPSHFRSHSTRKYLSKWIKPFICVTLALLLSGVNHMLSKDQYLFLVESAACTKEIKYKYNNYLKTERRILSDRLQKVTGHKISASHARTPTPEERLLVERPNAINISELIESSQKKLTIPVGNGGTVKKSHEAPRSPEMNNVLNNFLQTKLSPYEIEQIQRKLALITPINKKATKYLGFTKAAQVSIAMFPDEAIDYAAQNTQKHLTGEARFDYFFKLCMLHCITNSIPINPEARQKMHDLFKIHIDSPKVKVAVIQRQPTKAYFERKVQAQTRTKKESQQKYDYKMKQGGSS